MAEITNLVVGNNKLEFDYQGEKVVLKKTEVYPQIKVLLSGIYRQKLRHIQQLHQLSLKGSIVFLLDLYYLKNPEMLDVWLRLILSRLEQGINDSFALKLKYIYVTIGHFLKKYRYID